MERYIFLDTNIYINARYSFESPHMKKLSELITEDALVLLCCSTCMGEVEKHIKNDLRKAVKELNKALKMMEFAALRNEDLYKDKLRKMDEESSVEYVLKKFRDYLQENNAVIFSLQDIDIEEVMQDYFDKKAPFEEQKPNEFKDAIMIKALKKYQCELGEKIIIVSSDKGFRQAFSDNSNFVLFEKLVDFLQYQQRTDNIQEAFEEYFENDLEYEKILDELDGLVQSIQYYFDEREEFEIRDIEVDDITYEFNYAEAKSDEYTNAFLTVYFYVKIKCKYLDLENSYYDKQNKEYVIKSYIESKEIHRFEHEIILDFDCKQNKEKFELTFDRVNENMYDIMIDLSENDTLFDCIDQKSVMEEKDKKWFENNVIKCSECGKILGFNDSGNFHDYNGEPICDSCAVTNDKGFICPMCGFKNPYERMGNSGTFCVDCEENNDI